MVRKFPNSSRSITNLSDFHVCYFTQNEASEVQLVIGSRETVKVRVDLRFSLSPRKRLIAENA